MQFVLSPGDRPVPRTLGGASPVPVLRYCKAEGDGEIQARCAGGSAGKLREA